MATVTLLQAKSLFWRNQGQHWSGTATGGSTSTLICSSLINLYSSNYPFKSDGKQVRITSGSAIGDLRQVARAEPDTGTLRPQRDFSAAVASTNTFELWGDAIDGGQPLTDLFNDVLRPLKPITDTQVTIVTSQRVYDITTNVQAHTDVLGLYVRELDPQSLEPYRVRTLRQGLDWTVVDRGGAGTTSVTLTLATPLTLDATVRQLWLRHRTGFTAFSSDASTFDAVYLDWVAAEATAYHAAQQKMAHPADKARWDALLDFCYDSRGLDLLAFRRRWMPREPVLISTFP